MIEIFILAILIAYYIDFRNNEKSYGKNGQTWIYILAISAIVLLILKWVLL